ncbi:MAG: hypothetical protein M3Q58_09865 [Bacteroidota bacterium]|nr:hypothetical protein [Bacteroidota bacterium]
MTKKKWFLLIPVAVIVIAAAIFFIQQYNSEKSGTTAIDPAFSEYISAFTNGYISRESSIRIILSQDYKDQVESGQPVNVDLFSFSPKISGNAFWIDNRTIEFRPSSSLPSGQDFVGEFLLWKVMDVPKKLKTFEFSFHIVPQSFDVYVDGVKTIDKKTLRWQQLKGTVSTADVADAEDIRKIISATKDGKALTIKWEPTNNRTEFKFVVDSIERTEVAGKMFLNWNGEPIGLKNSSSKEIEIPSLDDFKILDVKVFQEPEQYAALQFSDPVMEKQNLSGLVQILGIQGVRLMVEDNEIRIYPSSRISGPKTVTAETGVKNVLGYPLKNIFSMEVAFEELKPLVRLLGKGVILPASSEGLIFPFEAVNLRAVDIKIVKIFENNMLQFMQINALDGEKELSRVGKTVFKKTITLSNKISELKRWNTYSLDLSDLIKTEEGAIYKVSIGFKKEYSTYSCEGETQVLKEFASSVSENLDNEDAVDGSEYNSYYYYDDYYDDYDYYDEDYNYSERDNPCSKSYFINKRDVSRNILASDLGLIAKRGADGNMLFFVTDLKTTKSVANTTLEIYDFQKQLITTVKTNSEGTVELQLKKSLIFLLLRTETKEAI